MELELSRIRAAVTALGSQAEDPHRFWNKKVLVTGDCEVLHAPNGVSCLLDSLRLLIRMCPNVTVALPRHCRGLETMVHEAVDPLAFGKAIAYSAIDSLNLGEFDAILSVGYKALGVPWATVVNANGWLVRVSSDGSDLPAECSQVNPMAAMAAASLGAAEVFKRLLKVKPSRGPLIKNLSYSLYSYEESTDPGPALPDEVDGNVLVVGLGAIGNGLTRLISQLPLAGPVWLVDPQTYGPENLGTCLLLGPGDIGKSKAQHAAEILRRAGFMAKGFTCEISEFAARVGEDIPVPRVTLNGLDSILARRQVQDLWLDFYVDGAIGPFVCQVSRHPWESDIACLKCLYPEVSGQLAEAIESDRTGLTMDRVKNTLSAVTQADIDQAPNDRRDWLRDRLGQPICSVIQEAMARSVAEEPVKTAFEPSVPFVATMSSAMVVSELVKPASVRSLLSPRYQFDILQGPQHGLSFPQGRDPQCECVGRRDNIERVRRARRGSLAHLRDL